MKKVLYVIILLIVSCKEHKLDDPVTNDISQFFTIQDLNFEFVPKNKKKTLSAVIFNNSEHLFRFYMPENSDDFKVIENANTIEILPKGIGRIDIEFAPQSKREYINKVRLNLENSSNFLELNLRGYSNKDEPLISLPDKVDFGYVPVGKSVSKEINFNNIYNFPISIASGYHDKRYLDAGGEFEIPERSEVARKIKFTPRVFIDVDTEIEYRTDTEDNLKVQILATSNFDYDAPPINLNEDLNFGYVAKGNRKRKSITIKNNCDFEFNISRISYPRGFYGINSITNIKAKEKFTFDIFFFPEEKNIYDGQLILITDFGINLTSKLKGESFRIPVVSTSDNINIGYKTAGFSGELESGDLENLTMGFIWGTSSEPTFYNYKNYTTNNAKLGVFTETVDGLNTGTRYYVRFYAKNNYTTVYGGVKAFETKIKSTPDIETLAASNISYTSADCGWNIIDNGGRNIDYAGLVWNISENPTIYNNIGYSRYYTDAGKVVKITGLNIGTTYYVRAYMKYSGGIVYGDSRSFSTLSAKVPKLSTEVVKSFYENANCNGKIIDNGGVSINERGFIWKSNGLPTIYDNDGRIFNGISGDDFTSFITSLTPGTNYYVKAYAINSEGIGYGDLVYLRTKNYGLFTDSRDNKSYKTVVIGEQKWMAENLAYLPSVYSQYDGSEYSGNSNKKFYYVYGYNGTNVSNAKLTNNYSTLGVLYNKNAAMHGESASYSNPSNVQGVCPNGWHLPSKSEYEELFSYLKNNGFSSEQNNSSLIAKSLASTSGWKETNTYYVGGNQLINNTTGFGARSGGKRRTYFEEKKYYSHFWTSSNTWSVELSFNESDVRFNFSNSKYGLSVRCVED